MRMGDGQIKQQTEGEGEIGRKEKEHGLPKERREEKRKERRREEKKENQKMSFIYSSITDHSGEAERKGNNLKRKRGEKNSDV